MLQFAEYDAGRLARALSGGVHAEKVELNWEQERPQPFWKTTGPVPCQGELKDDLLAAGRNWVKHRKPTLGTVGGDIRYADTAVL